MQVKMPKARKVRGRASTSSLVPVHGDPLRGLCPLK